MGHFSHHPPAFRVVALSAVVGAFVAACAGKSDEPGAVEDPEALVEAAAGEDATVRVEDRCDLGFNTATFNDTAELVQAGAHGPHHSDVAAVDFTVQEWAGVFASDDFGLTVEQVADQVDADDIYRRHVLGGVLTSSLDPAPWQAMTDSGDCAALADELRQAVAVAVRYPTVADAVAGGYSVGDSYYAGLGVHYQTWDYRDVFEPGSPDQLLYAGTAPDSALVGLSYVVTSPNAGPPAGFTGDNDHWHRHRSFCVDPAQGAVNLSSDVLSEDECGELNGAFVPNTNLWMLHSWIVPGCESDWGIFSSANPRLPYVPPGAVLGPGCNSGKTVSEPLALDVRGNGPRIG